MRMTVERLATHDVWVCDVNGFVFRQIETSLLNNRLFLLKDSFLVDSHMQNSAIAFCLFTAPIDSHMQQKCGAANRQNCGVVDNIFIL